MAKTCKAAVVLLLFFMLAPFHPACAADCGSMRLGVTIFAEGRRNGISNEDASIMTNSLTNALVGTPGLRIYERQQLEAAVREQNLGRRVSMNENTVVELGQLAGLQYVLIGSIDSLGRTERSTHVPIRGLSLGNMSVRSERLAVSIRMIDVATGAVVMTFSEEGSAQDIQTRGVQSSLRISGDLRNRALHDAMTRLSPKIQSSLADFRTHR